MKLSALDELLTLSNERRALEEQLKGLATGKIRVQILTQSPMFGGNTHSHEDHEVALAVRPGLEAVLQARLVANAAALAAIGVEVA